MPVVSYLTIDGEVISETRNGVERDYLPDPLGSTAALLDSTQTKTDTFSYWPYGEERTTTGSTGTTYRFVGTLGYRKETSSRTYVRARHYRTDQARWITRDPLWPDESPFEYVSGTPINRIDPTGNGPTYSQPSMFDCNEGSKCLGILVRFSGSKHPFDGRYTQCFHNHPEWVKNVSSCACCYNVSPIALMALMFVESHFGTDTNNRYPDIHCWNPTGYHFREVGSIESLLKPDGSYPSISESVCGAASLIDRDQGFKQGVWGQAKDDFGRYKEFRKICQDKGVL